MLLNNIHLCYINGKDLFEWIAKNNLRIDNFQREKQKWAKEINKTPNFFSDTELLLVYQDILLLKVNSDNRASFLAKIYQLEYQNICQKLFSEKKNIIIISDRQWKEQQEAEKLIVLFKDKENIKNSLNSWLKLLKDKKSCYR